MKSKKERTKKIKIMKKKKVRKRVVKARARVRVRVKKVTRKRKKILNKQAYSKHIGMKRGLTSLLIAWCALMYITLGETAHAQNGADLSLAPESVHFSQDVFLEGNPVTIYATIQNTSNKDLLGTVQFYDETTGTQIGSDQTISVFSHKTDDVFIQWIPYQYGDHTIHITVDPWEAAGDDPSNNRAIQIVTVLQDTDYDGIANTQDPDDDNDNVPDQEDDFPLNAAEWVDTDGDRIGDNEDPDDDNDTYPDDEDAFMYNPLEWNDHDGDGIGDNEDTDDDNDDLSDIDEQIQQTDPLNADSDGDTCLDGEDAFPLNPEEQKDYDQDGIGDNEDDDDDNDGLRDTEDQYDNNKGPVIIVEGNTTQAIKNRPLTLNAANSYDEDGSIADIQWILNKNTTQTGPIFTHTVTSEDDLTLSVAVIDDRGEIRKESFIITVFNLDFYLAGALIWIIIVLAIVIYLKYSSRAKRI
ncbi:PKD domain-containing protein [Candidatus Peregrinibacteria bacterium]|nr:PKD domain-containing protein [Candidatus Peregrinibacteria bacterium]